MNLQKYKSLGDLTGLFTKIILPQIGHIHIDFGCGDGFSTYICSRSKTNSLIVGYDSNTEKIKIAKDTFEEGSRLTFTNSLDFFTKNPPNSAGANFVFHEDTNILGEIYSLLPPGGKACILDYNLKGLSKQDFLERFCLDNELKVLAKEGVELCHQKHTRYGVIDCVEQGTALGFETTRTEVSGNYYVWAGKKRLVSQFHSYKTL